MGFHKVRKIMRKVKQPHHFWMIN